MIGGERLLSCRTSSISINQSYQQATGREHGACQQVFRVPQTLPVAKLTPRRPTLAACSNHQDTVAGCRLLRGAIKLNHGFLSHSPEPNIRHSLTSPQTLSLQSRLEVSLLCRAAGPARHAQADASERLVDMHGTLILINPFDRLTSFLCPSIRLPTLLNPMLAAPCLRHHPPPGEPCQTDQ